MIDAFEGPLDLLLHLIKKSSIAINDINIVDITKQYLDYINCMEKMNLDVASEYLDMAAELIEMKSNVLIPQVLTDEVVDERQELINRLLDYQQYKNMINYFKNLEVNRRDEFTRSPSNLKDYGCISEMHLSTDLSIDNLVAAFNKFLVKKEKEKPLKTKITSKEYSVSERSNEIKSLLKHRKRLEFSELFVSYEKSYIIVTFLAILDLVKQSSVKVSQSNNFEDIYIEDVAW